MLLNIICFDRASDSLISSLLLKKTQNDDIDV